MSVLWTASRIRKNLGTPTMSSVVYDVVGLPIDAIQFVNVRFLNVEPIRVGTLVIIEVTWNADHIKALSIKKSTQCNIGGCVDNSDKTKEEASANKIVAFVRHQKMGTGCYYSLKFDIDAKENRRMLGRRMAKGVINSSV